MDPAVANRDLPGHVTSADLLRGIGWLLRDAGRFDLDRLAAGLAGRQLRLDTAAGARTLQRGIAETDLPLGWSELRVGHAGRRRPCLAFDHQSGAVVLVHAYRLGRHRVRITRDGHASERSLRTPELARLLGVAPDASIVVLAISPRLPLEPLHHAKASAWSAARTLLALDRSDIRLAFVYGIAIGLLYVVTPVAVQSLVNTIALGALLQPLLVLTVLVAVVLTVSGVMRILQAHVVEAIQARMFVRASADVSRRLLAAPASALERASPAELTARFLEVTVLQKATAILLVDGIDLLLRLFVGMALLAVYHPMLLLFSLSILLLLVAVVVIGGRGAVATALEESAAKYRMVAWLEESVRMAGVVRGEAGRRRALDRADQLARRYRDARRMHFGKLARQLAGSVAIQVLGSAVLLGLGGSLVVAGQLTLGQLVAAELVFASIAFALVKLHKQLEAVYDVIASSKKLAGLTDLPALARGGERLVTPGAMAVRLVGATVEHAGAGRVFDAVSLAIARGERIAITGTAGCGKTTLLEVLALQQPLAGGQLVLDGFDVRQLAPEHARAQVVLSRGADHAMLHASIEANLRLAAPAADHAAIRHALAAVHLDDEVARMRDGLGTELTPVGRPLSTSATRRLALARAVLARRRLWLVDGAFDDLGLVGDVKAQVLDRLLARADVTMVIVSDDPDVLARCDRRFELVAGTLVEVA